MNTKRIKVLKNRVCLMCNKIFKPMTDWQWKNILIMHKNYSIRHKKFNGERE